MPLSADEPGAPCWLSLATHDLGAAEDFYGAVLGWTFRHGPLGAGFSVGERDGVPVAGIGDVARRMGVPVAWMAYWAVGDADAAVARIRERGGTVGVGPVAFPPRGRAALATDLEGAAFGVWEGRVSSRWQLGERHAPVWLELHARNAFDAAVFYGGVFQWVDGDAVERFELSYEDEQVVLRRHGEAVARLNSGPVEASSAKPQLRPRWLVHFRVPDLDRATAAVLDHGGSLVPEADDGWQALAGRWATVRDPQGGLFTLDEWRGEGDGG
ncbi:hydroxylase [Streptomyces laurentii]|uniref:Hydroxylase n=1 Tax=Streptomyces laurentii TaxID=39478 RepID=A0A160NU74_STRLU|nr:hydroxylase [Streptomyces laurentii]